MSDEYKGIGPDLSKDYWPIVVIWFVLILVFIAADVFGEVYSSFTCRPFIYPRVMCEAKSVGEFTPKWTVSIDDKRADYDMGTTVYLTLPDEKFAKVEMCTSEFYCIHVWGGFFNKNPAFHKR